MILRKQNMFIYNKDLQYFHIRVEPILPFSTYFCFQQFFFLFLQQYFAHNLAIFLIMESFFWHISSFWACRTAVLE